MITVASEDIFLISNNQTIIVRLPSFEWEFTLGANVRLRAGRHSLLARQIGTGNHEGRATIVLSPYAQWTNAVREVRNLGDSGQPIVLEVTREEP